MLVTNIPHPFFGPPDVRFLLAFRGFSGVSITVSPPLHRFFSIYLSLRYLTLSDTTVLTFLAPLCTAAVGAAALGENIGWKEFGAVRT